MIAIAFTIIFIALIVSIIFMLRSPEQTGTLRDIMIILLAVEFMFIGVALVVLIVQLAKLTALIQNEVAPMLQSSSEALNYLRGTTVFMSEHLVDPVIEANSKLAGLRRGIGTIFTTRNR